MLLKKISVLIGLLVFLCSPIVFAQTSDYITVDVTITSSAAIELNETGINFGSVAPMANSTIRDLLITNIGSTTVGNVYATTNTWNKNTTNPRASGSASDYMATQFLTIKNDTASSTGTYFYAGAILWNYSAAESTSGWTFTPISSVSKRMFGELWIDGSSTTDLYYWEIINGTGSEQALCNQSNTDVNVKTARNDKDMTTGTATVSAASQNNQWATWTFTNGPLQNYCLATYFDCTKAYIYRWDYNSTWPSCGTRAYFLGVNSLVPSATHTISLKMVVPPKIPAGATTQATLTVWAS